MCFQVFGLRQLSSTKEAEDKPARAAVPLEAAVSAAFDALGNELTASASAFIVQGPSQGQSEFLGAHPVESCTRRGSTSLLGLS